jgi:hypothetical protein
MRYEPLAGADRGDAGEAYPGSAERIAAGWQRRFVVDSSRVTEMVRLYRALGYETAVDPILPDDLRDEPADGGGEAPDRIDDRCRDCRLVTMGWLHILYTRAAPPARAD